MLQGYVGVLLDTYIHRDDPTFSPPEIAGLTRPGVWLEVIVTIVMAFVGLFRLFTGRKQPILI